MRILYDDQIFARQRFGGISRYFVELIARLGAQRDFEVVAFEGWTINGYGLARHSPALKGYVGARRPQVGGRPLPLGSYVSEAWLRAWALGRQFDIYHPTYYRPSYHAVKARARVLTVYDMIHELFPQGFSRRDPTTRQKRRAIGAADAIIAISENTRADLVRLFEIPANRVDVIYLGSSIDQVVAVAPPRPLAAPYLLFVGDRRAYKNFGLLVRAFARSRSAQELSLVSVGGGAFTKGEQALLDECGVRGRVSQYTASESELRWLYEHAVAFVCPSLYEGFGIPALEAMTLGCPVVCSNVSSLPEVVGDAAALFDPADVECLQQALVRVVDDQSYRAQLSARGRLRASTFSWQRCADETAALYRRLGA